MANFELYGTAHCPYTQDMRDWLEFNRKDFIEYDVEADLDARQRMRELDSSLRKVPVLVENGKVLQIGWQGHGCPVE
ncbi:MAG TPA: glutaredoxin domain-containing protein [Candidatus Angelobacter sp.]|jgi:glutaredoxin 3